MSAVVTVGPVALKVHRRPVVVAAALLVLLAVVGVAALCAGEYAVSPARAIAVLAGGGQPVDRLIVGQLRLPRVLTGALVGVALGVAGALFQSMSRNPLGSPDVIGLDSGASTGALVAILLLHAGAGPTAVGALVGGAGTAVAVFVLALRDGIAPLRLVLVGVGAGAALSAVNSTLVVQAQITDAQTATAWLVGNLAGSTWGGVALLAAPLVVGLAGAALIARPLALTELPDARTRSLGAHPQRIRVAAIGAGVLLAGAAVATAGPVPFIALTAPQVARRLTRAPGPHLGTAGLAGAVLLVAADLAARQAFEPREVAVGVVTGIVGGGYLAWLLAREWRAGRA